MLHMPQSFELEGIREAAVVLRETDKCSSNWGMCSMFCDTFVFVLSVEDHDWPHFRCEAPWIAWLKDVISSENGCNVLLQLQWCSCQFCKIDYFVYARARLEETAARLQRLLELESTEASPTAARAAISTPLSPGNDDQQPAPREDKDPGEELVTKRRRLLAHAQHLEL